MSLLSLNNYKNYTLSNYLGTNLGDSIEKVDQFLLSLIFPHLCTYHPVKEKKGHHSLLSLAPSFLLILRHNLCEYSQFFVVVHRW
jgi:hypothetical protein